MAAGVLPPPGAESGPCAGTCHHRDCAVSRGMAAGICAYCSKPIGWGVPFYVEDAQAEGALAHATCAETAAEERAR